MKDLATFAYLRDIFVLPEHRARGYGKALVQAMMSRLKAQGVPSIDAFDRGDLELEDDIDVGER